MGIYFYDIYILYFNLKTFVPDEPKCENTTVPYPPGEGEWSCDYENQYCTLGCPHHCHMKKAENNPVYW